MSVHRFAARRDANEAEIISALLAHGFSVRRLSAKGLPDLACGWRGRTILVEVKGATGKLTPDQQRFWVDWRGNPCVILRTVDDVTALALAWQLVDRDAAA